MIGKLTEEKTNLIKRNDDEIKKKEKKIKTRAGNQTSNGKFH